MLNTFNRNTLVFTDFDVAMIFVQKSLIAKRLPLSMIETAGKLAVLTFDTWDIVTEEETIDIVFFPNIISIVLNQEVTKHPVSSQVK